MFDGRTLHAREAIEILQENFGDLVFETRIRKTIRYAEAPVKGTLDPQVRFQGLGGSCVPGSGGGGAPQWQNGIACETGRWPSSSSRRRSRPRAAPSPRSEPAEAPARKRPAKAEPAPQRPTLIDLPDSDSYPEKRIPRADDQPYIAVIRVVGVGGGGCNAINRMIEADLTRRRVHCRQHRHPAAADVGRHDEDPHRPRADAGPRLRCRPRRSAALAAEDSYDRIKTVLRGSDMVFVTAGEGGGTGSGAAPVVARIAREVGALTVGIVTSPFGFEGTRRADPGPRGRRRAARGIGHGDRHPQRPPARRAGQADAAGRRVQGRRRRAAPGRAGDLRPDHPARPDQPGLRRRPHRDGGRRHRDDGHRHGQRPEPGAARRRPGRSAAR